MYKILTKLAPIFVAFLMFVNLPVHAKGYAHDYDAYEVDLYDTTYDLCLVKAAEEGGDFMGLLQIEEDTNDLCGCAAETAVDVYDEDLIDSELDAIIEQKALQCLQPYIKPFITKTCLAAAADNGVTDATQKCDCLGKHVDAHLTNNVRDFFDDFDKYLDASVTFCRLDD